MHVINFNNMHTYLLKKPMSNRRKIAGKSIPIAIEDMFFKSGKIVVRVINLNSRYIGAN